MVQGHLAEAGLVIHDGLALRGDPPEQQLRPGMVPLDMIHQVPLLPVCRVTINAIELLNVIVNILPVSLHCSVPCEKFPTDVTRKVSLTMMNDVDVILKRLIVLINIPTHMTREGLLLPWFSFFPPAPRSRSRFASVMLEVVFILV